MLGGKVYNVPLATRQENSRVRGSHDVSVSYSTTTGESDTKRVEWYLLFQRHLREWLVVSCVTCRAEFRISFDTAVGSLGTLFSYFAPLASSV